MRNLDEVIDQILEQIPQTEVSFISSLQSCRSSVMFSAPELMSLRWQETATVLNENIGEPSEDWQEKIVKIWMGNESTHVE